MSDPERPRTTPEGHTPEEPHARELGKSGTPGAGMTPAVPHVADARAMEGGEAPARGEPIGESHAVAAEAHVDDDEHAHTEPRLGPVDWPAWSYAIIGVVVALVIVALFYVAVS
jgi:hypothetical protein